MNCKTFYINVMPFESGKLSAEMEQEMEAHIQACPSCRRIYSEYFLATKLLENSEKLEVDASYYTRLKARMEREEKARVGYNYLINKALQPAFYTILLLVSIYFGLALGLNVEQNTGNRNSSLQAYADEIYLNEIAQDGIETSLLSE